MDPTQKSSDLSVPKEARPTIALRAFRCAKGAPTARHWVRGDPYATAFFNALSAVFPQGETFMIRSIVPWVERVPPSLAREVTSFIAQEAGHAREHIAMNRGMIEAGYDVDPLERRIKRFVKLFENASDMVKLTATMCFEHFTAIVAAEILKNSHHLHGADAELRELWLWHGIEEVEHKGVAFDVWQYATREWSPAKRWLWRSFFMVAITASFFINRTLGQIELLRQDGVGFRTALPNILRHGFAEGGIARNVTRPWFSFFRPGFHPWDIDDRLLIAEGEAELASAAAKRAGYQPEIASKERRTSRQMARVA